MQAKLLRHIKPPQDLTDIALARPGSIAAIDPRIVDITVYTTPTSICAQRVRMTLEEKGVAYSDHMINTAEYENLQPWYIKLNPRALVPTLKFGDRSLFDSNTIMLFIDNYFQGPSLSPTDPMRLQEMRSWLARLDEFPVRDLSYRWQLQMVDQGKANFWRPAMHDNILRARKRFPEHQELFDLKLAEWDDIEKCVADETHIAGVDATAMQFADDLESALSSSDYVVGDAFSLADISATLLLVRLQCGCALNLWGSGLRPQVEDYITRMKRRQSYRRGLLEPYKRTTAVVLQGDCWFPSTAAA